MTQLIHLARQLQREADSWVPAFLETGAVDPDGVARVGKLRQQIITAKAETPLDSLMQLGATFSIAAFMYLALEDETQDPKDLIETLRESALELLIGLSAIRQRLESDAGQTLAGLGLFVTGGSLQ